MSFMQLQASVKKEKKYLFTFNKYDYWAMSNTLFIYVTYRPRYVYDINVSMYAYNSFIRKLFVYFFFNIC